MRKTEEISKDLTAINDIIKRIDNVKYYIGEMDESQFQQSEIIQEATIRQIEVIGEAVKRMSEETRGQFKNFPWKDAAGMRDVLVHQYDRVNLSLVWDTAKTELPGYLEEINKIKNNLKYELLYTTLWKNLPVNKKKLLQNNHDATAVGKFKDKLFLMQISKTNNLYFKRCEVIEKEILEHPLSSGINITLTQEQAHDISLGEEIQIRDILVHFDVVKNKLITGGVPPPNKKKVNQFTPKR